MRRASITASLPLALALLAGACTGDIVGAGGADAAGADATAQDDDAGAAATDAAGPADAPTSPPPDATPPLPTCGCYYGNGLYCGAGVVDEAASRSCAVDLVPAHAGDLLRCTDGAWTVETACPEGCVVAPPGMNDYCSSSGAYYLPWACGVSYTCTQGNNSAFSHTGTQAWAYDFGMPRGTPVRAARAGTVTAADLLVGPGDACWDGCADSACCDACINTVNRVKVSHGDGTAALYLHLDAVSVAVGSVVARGAVLGQSGNTGCSFGAHLHFQAEEDCAIWFCNSLPISFAEGAEDTGVTLASGNCP